jgi:hypothetical protein
VSPPRLFGALDAVVLAMVALGAAFAWMKGPGEQGSRATAYVGGKPIAWWALSGEPRRDTVAGAIGPVWVEHGGGSIRIVGAPCPNHLCMRQGEASHAHDRLVCVPSRLVIVLEGAPRKHETLDAVH